MADDETSLVDLQGRGITFPLRRDQKSDFANASGVEAMKSNMLLGLGTRAQTGESPGDVAWDGSIGSTLHLLEHRLGNPALDELARHYVVSSLRTIEPRARITSVRVRRDGTRSTIHVKFLPTDGNGNLTGDSESVEIPLPER
jgi:hypothetical protein